MTVRIGIIGCGAIARRTHIPAFAKTDDADVVAFASRTRGSAEAAAGDHGSGTVYDDWRDVLPDVDAVSICSPNACHREQAVAAAKAGKHVLVEKPIACTVDEADEMIATARDAGVVLFVAQNLRYLAPVVAAHDFIASGRIGDIVGVRAAFGHSGPKGWAPGSTWFYERESSGGGALIDLGIHIIDLVGYVTSLRGEQVTAMTSGALEVEDAAQLVVRFENGATGSVHASWVARPAPDMTLTIFGSEGTLHFDAKTPLTFRPAEGEKEQIELPHVTSNPYADFVRAVRNESVEGPLAPAAQGRDALAIVCAAYESAASGRTIEVSR